MFSIVALLALLATVAISTMGTPAAAQTSDGSTGGDSPSTTVATTDGSTPVTEAVDPGLSDADLERDALLRDGAKVFSQNCSSCHQPGGEGLPGQFPPLLNNPNVDDAEYVRGVINNGRQGQLTVLGETYDGVMPPFSTLKDDEIEAVITYLQADFQAPVESQESFDAAQSGPVAGTELPLLTDLGTWLAYLLPVLVGALVLAPRLIGRSDRLSMPWLDAWLKTATIVVSMVLAVVVLPDFVLTLSAVSELDRPLQDLIGLVVWGGGLALGLWGLWYAHRESRI